MKLTIKDIAKLAGVSTATISMVVNKKDERISVATREKVLRIIEENGYVPNRIASSMVTKSTKTIGLVIPDIANPFFPELARGVEDRANAAGYNVILCNSDNKLEKEDSYIEMLQEKMVDGIIFNASSRRIEVSNVLKKVKLPVVTVDREILGLTNQGKITVNNEKGAFEAVNHMRKNNYNNIVHISGPMTSKTAKERYTGYLKALNLNEDDMESSKLYEGSFTSEWGYDAVKKIVSSNQEFDGIFCGNDMIALGALKALKENGRKVPEQVGLVGFDDIYMAKMVTPELTTVRQPKYEMGYQAADLLIKMINNEPIKKHDYILDSQFIERKSTQKEEK